jgi:hypothetical protein
VDIQRKAAEILKARAKGVVAAEISEASPIKGAHSTRMRSFSFRVAIDVLAFVQDPGHYLVYVPARPGCGQDPGPDPALGKA